MGLLALSSLLNIIETEALVTPACPFLYTSSCRLPTRTCGMQGAAVTPQMLWMSRHPYVFCNW